MDVLICDDDKYVRKMLEKILSQNKYVNKTYMVGNGLEAVKLIGNHTVDVALLDIDMPYLDGLEVAKVLKKTAPQMEFVFITGYMEYAIDSFCVHPYDYILKPIDVERLEGVLKELYEKLSKAVPIEHKDAKKLRIQKGAHMLLIPFDDILYLEKSNREVLIHTKDEAYGINKSLLEIEKELPSNNVFVRTHKSFIVNITKIKRINVVGNRSFQVMFLDSAKEAVLSRHKYDEVMKHISIY